MLFLWFHSTVRLPGNEIGSVLGKLKSEVRHSTFSLSLLFTLSEGISTSFLG